MMRPNQKRPVSLDDYFKSLNNDGCIDENKKNHLLHAIFYNGIDPPARSVLWKYLTGFYHWSDSTADRSHKDQSGR